MGNMRFKVGDRVLIKSLDWYNKNKDEYGDIDVSHDFTFYADRSKYCGRVFTIDVVFDNCYTVKEDNHEYYWSDEMIEGLEKEETKPNTIEEAKTYWDSIKDAWICPEGYIFKDENGNVINATKIVLEKKKKEVILTQEQIDTMVYDSCVLFCKHCGCGIPRDTCTSLGTCKEHDEYRTAIRTHLMGNKKKEYPKTYEEYPKTYEECREILKEQADVTYGYKKDVLHSFQKLLVCRDAYWKIAGEEMGLGKLWEPDWAMYSGLKHCIIYSNDEIKWRCKSFVTEAKILAFPTEEMRDAFYENFKKEIEQCKELL